MNLWKVEVTRYGLSIFHNLLIESEVWYDQVQKR